MGATYTRQSTFTDGDVITSDLFNNEYDQLLAAFASSTGHTHDGTAGEGGPITLAATDVLTIGTNAGDVSIVFNGGSNDGTIKWMEDEDYFEFSDDILMATTEKIQFTNTSNYIHSASAGNIDLVAATEIHLVSTTINMDGNADISGNLGIGGNLTVTGTTTFNGGTLTLGADATDNVAFGADVNSSIIPNGVNGSFDLGSASQEWRDLFINGTAHIDTLDVDIDATVAGTLGVTGVATVGGLTIGSAVITEAELEILDGANVTTAELNIIDGGTSATSTTVADADRVVLNDNGTMVQVAVTDLAAYFDDEITAMPNLVTTAATTVGALNSGSITSGFGTIDTGSSTITTTGLISGGSLDIDNVLINGTTIGHTDDTDLITLADGIVTVAGEVSLTTLDIGGTNVTSTAAELNIVDGGTSATSTTVVDADRVVMNDNGTMVQVAVTDLAAYFDDEITAMPNLVTTAATTVGALDSGSITSNFGTINTGASAVTTTGLITGGSLTVDDVAIDGKVITMTGSSSDTAVFTAAANGAFSLVTTDAGGAAANIQITADGTAELAGTTVTLDSAGDIELAATDDINVPSGVGMTFGNDGEIIEGDGTNLAISSSGDLNVTATTVDINATTVEISGATTQTGISTSAATDIFNAGLSVKNGSTSGGFVQFFESGGTSNLKVIAPALAADATLTLPAVAGTIATVAAAIDEATALAIALG